MAAATWRLRVGKVLLLVRVWGWFVVVQLLLHRRSLPSVAEVLCRPPRRTRDAHLEPRRLGGFVYRRLRVGPYRPRCLLRALVHLRLLRAQGLPAELIIGLPERPTNKDAHAWVEIDGVVVGPPPGRAGHVEFVRYPSTAPPKAGGPGAEGASADPDLRESAGRSTSR